MYLYSNAITYVTGYQFQGITIIWYRETNLNVVSKTNKV